VGGQSAVNQAPVTGESVPVDKAAGDDVFAGTVNGEGALEVRTTRAVGDRTLDRVIRLVEDAQTSKAPTQQFTERFERVFVPLVLVSAVAVMIVPPLIGWATWSTAVYRALTLLVAASPCALALGTPSAVLAGIAQAARRGVIIKGGVHLENLGTLRTMTSIDRHMTLGQPEVTGVVTTGDRKANTARGRGRRATVAAPAQAVVEPLWRKLLVPAGPARSSITRGCGRSLTGNPSRSGKRDSGPTGRSRYRSSWRWPSTNSSKPGAAS
jgi:Cd2+/Zn2+-exporting ATPase